MAAAEPKKAKEKRPTLTPYPTHQVYPPEMFRADGYSKQVIDPGQDLVRGHIGYSHEELKSFAGSLIRVAELIKDRRPSTIFVPERGSVPLVQGAIAALREMGVTADQYHPHIMYMANTGKSLRGVLRSLVARTYQRVQPEDFKTDLKASLRKRLVDQSFSSVENKVDMELHVVDKNKKKFKQILKRLPPSFKTKVYTRPKLASAESAPTSNIHIFLEDKIERCKRIMPKEIKRLIAAGVEQETIDHLNHLIIEQQNMQKRLDQVYTDVSKRYPAVSDKFMKRALEDVFSLRQDSHEIMEKMRSEIHVAGGKEPPGLAEAVDALISTRDMVQPKLDKVLLVDETISGGALMQNAHTLIEELPPNTKLSIIGVLQESGRQGKMRTAPSKDLREEIKYIGQTPVPRFEDVQYVPTSRILSLDRSELLGVSYLMRGGRLYGFDTAGEPLQTWDEPADEAVHDSEYGTGADSFPIPPTSSRKYKLFLHDISKKVREILEKEKKAGSKQK